MADWQSFYFTSSRNIVVISQSTSDWDLNEDRGCRTIRWRNNHGLAEHSSSSNDRNNNRYDGVRRRLEGWKPFHGKREGRTTSESSNCHIIQWWSNTEYYQRQSIQHSAWFHLNHRTRGGCFGRTRGTKRNNWAHGVNEDDAITGTTKYWTSTFQCST